jgi:hypothetical protein
MDTGQILMGTRSAIVAAQVVPRSAAALQELVMAVAEVAAALRPDQTGLVDRRSFSTAALWCLQLVEGVAVPLAVPLDWRVPLPLQVPAVAEDPDRCWEPVAVRCQAGSGTGEGLAVVAGALARVIISVAQAANQPRHMVEVVAAVARSRHQAVTVEAVEVAAELVTPVPEGRRQIATAL